MGQQHLRMFGGLGHGDRVRKAEAEAFNILKGLPAAVRSIHETQIVEVDIPAHMGIGDLLRKDGEESIFFLDPLG
jgi:hypothetical protein